MSKYSDYDFETVTTQCDNCGREYEIYGTTDYREANAELRIDGWINTWRDGTFLDFCSKECRDAYFKEKKNDTRS